MTVPYAPIWLQPSTAGMLSNRRGSNQTNDAIILKTRYSNPNNADRPGLIRVTASRTAIAGVPTSVPQLVWDSGFVGNISSTAFPYTTSIGGVVAPVGPNCMAMWKGRVYVLVADQRTTSTDHVGVIYSAPLSGSTVGAWRLESSPSDSIGAQSGEICNPGGLTIIAGYMYVMTTRTIWMGTIQGDGTIAGWNDNLNTVFEFSPGVFPATPVMMAGYDQTGWTSTIVLSSSGAHSFGFLIVVGSDGKVYRYLIDNDGDIETSSSTDTGLQTTLPATRQYSAIHIDDGGWILVIGGEPFGGGSPVATVYYATCAVSFDGAVGSWSTSATPLTAGCEGNEKQIATALEEYAVDHNGSYGAGGTVTSTLLGTLYLGVTPTDPVDSSNYSVSTTAGSYGSYQITDAGNHDLTTTTGLPFGPGTGSIIYNQNSGLLAK